MEHSEGLLKLVVAQLHLNPLAPHIRQVLHRTVLDLAHKKKCTSMQMKANIATERVSLLQT